MSTVISTIHLLTAKKALKCFVYPGILPDVVVLTSQFRKAISKRATYDEDGF